jgi:photosystem II stability/assembly factor-like uncharacterized protein/CTP:phosphocholine cytidylyltransferase-like protein
LRDRDKKFITKEVIKMKRFLSVMLTILSVFLIVFQTGGLVFNPNQAKADMSGWVKLPLPVNDADAWVTSITIDPVNSKIIYVATLTNGIWKTVDGGQHWFQIFYQKRTVLSSIILDSRTNTIYVAVDVGPTGGGVLKSTDNGINWKWVLQEQSAGDVRLDPLNSDIVYVTTARGIFKSVDRGESWKLISEMICTLTLDPQDSQIMYAGTLEKGIFKSIDGGKSWFNLNKELGPTIDAILIDPYNHETIYVSTGRYGDDPGKGVFKSEDGGKTWKPINEGLRTLNMRGGMVYDNKNNIIYIGTQGMENEGGTGIYKTANGGESWESIGLEGLDILSLALDPNNPEIIYVGTMGDGFFRTNKLTITASSSGGGSISPSGIVNVNYGDSKTFTIIPNSGYKISDVQVDGKSVGIVSTYTFENISSDHTIEAIFEPTAFSVKASAGSGGSIFPSGIVNVNYGDSKTFTIIPNSGYKISDVQVDGKSVGIVSTYTFENISSDHTIEAIFEPTAFSVKASAGSGGSIFPSGVIIVNYGDSKTFTITPNSGYYIKDVKVDGKSVGVVSSYIFTNINFDHIIEVIFEKKTVIILQIGKTSFIVNSTFYNLDSPPVIKNGRTLLPIRAVIEALNGTVDWDATQRKVTVSLSSTTIELWIGKNTAKVNGVSKPIDSTNPKVVPEIINGRTMLPLRFVTENLGCQIQWDGATQTITISYPNG